MKNKLLKIETLKRQLSYVATEDTTVQELQDKATALFYDTFPNGTEVNLNSFLQYAYLSRELYLVSDDLYQV